MFISPKQFCWVVTFIRTCSVVQRLLQPASAPLELVPAVEDIGLVAVDSSSKAEEAH